jgi:hypothetical protein
MSAEATRHLAVSACVARRNLPDRGARVRHRGDAGLLGGASTPAQEREAADTWRPLDSGNGRPLLRRALDREGAEFRVFVADLS